MVQDYYGMEHDAHVYQEREEISYGFEDHPFLNFEDDAPIWTAFHPYEPPHKYKTHYLHDGSSARCSEDETCEYCARGGKPRSRFIVKVAFRDEDDEFCEGRLAVSWRVGRALFSALSVLEKRGIRKEHTAFPLYKKHVKEGNLDKTFVGISYNGGSKGDKFKEVFIDGAVNHKQKQDFVQQIDYESIEDQNEQQKLDKIFGKFIKKEDSGPKNPEMPF